MFHLERGRSISGPLEMNKRTKAKAKFVRIHSKSLYHRHIYLGQIAVMDFTLRPVRSLGGSNAGLKIQSDKVWVQKKGRIVRLVNDSRI